MAETILFDIPATQVGQDDPYEALWYQSSNGELWDLIPTDTVLITSLVTDTDSGKYSWTSEIVNSSRWHQLRLRTLLGVESLQGLTLSPRVVSEEFNQQSSVIANKIDSGIAEYLPGDTVELMLNLDAIASDIIGDTISIQILDYFNNLLDTIEASRVAETLYIAEYVIPNTVALLFNPSKEEYSLDYFILKDRWIIPDSTGLEYVFKVLNNVREQAVLGNCKYVVNIEGLLSSQNDEIDTITLNFSSSLSPYYATIQDVKSTYLDELKVIDDFDLVRDIILQSKQVDVHMKPDTVYRQAQYDLAVKMYVKYSTAKLHLNFLLNMNAESKELDTFKYSRNSNDPVKILESLDNLIQKYAYIILAGGKDTPFIPKTFSKGIWDPNRTNANRLGLDTSDPYPWVNTTTENSIININGNTVELRGTRTVSFLRNRSSYPNTYSRNEGVM